MNNVVSHQRFARAKVVQPCPRRRKGTISLKKYRRCRLLAEAAPKRMLVNSRNVAQVWIDGTLHFGELLEMLREAGLQLLSVKDEHGTEGLFIAKDRPSIPPPVA